jgi:beta-glucosidase-like glycosyl hydrolase
MEMGAVVQTLSVADASLRAIEAGSDMVLICEQEANFIATRDRLVEAVGEGRIRAEALDNAAARIDGALSIAGEYESFGEEEFNTVSRAIADLKQKLKSAEETGEYAPVYGTQEDTDRRSSNF